MEKIGLVTSVKENVATVEIRRASACGENCASCKGGCAPTNHYITAKNSVDASVGQYVKLEMENKSVLRAAFLVYIVPLIGMILGIGLGIATAEYLGYTASKEIIGAAVGFLFLIIFYFIISFIDKKIKRDKKMEVVITKIIH
ncbi:positive regulator of sigma(E), RseC/MucC [Natronincola peptidivorans]|uniref:Positive regulator of sigma(E), RseC/MucC n=1 Tax=Natronincola peptidivorans TaxID=426128 RepID=A0A1I0BFA2_9FIRM|nr:SoxR reducing system RseC family protein [Natronincola peptidivorans]SET05563.1 positive regulator of sigma(E), RseC/MucC [Natronincola peptidivorans]